MGGGAIAAHAVGGVLHGGAVVLNILLIYICMLSKHWWKKGHWSRFVTSISPGCSNRD
jgi:hypothetical protein